MFCTQTQYFIRSTQWIEKNEMTSHNQPNFHRKYPKAMDKCLRALGTFIHLTT